MGESHRRQKELPVERWAWPSGRKGSVGRGGQARSRAWSRAEHPRCAPQVWPTQSTLLKDGADKDSHFDGRLGGVRTHSEHSTAAGGGVAYATSVCRATVWCKGEKRKLRTAPRLHSHQGASRLRAPVTAPVSTRSGRRRARRSQRQSARSLARTTVTPERRERTGSPCVRGPSSARPALRPDHSRKSTARSGRGVAGSPFAGRCHVAGGCGGRGAGGRG